MDALANGRRTKCLTCVDDFTKECLTITVAFGISGVQVTRILDSIELFRGYPTTIRTDQGPEFTCRALNQWAFEHSVELRLIQPGKPTQNGLLRVLTDDFAMNVRISIGSAISFTPGKSLMTGGRIITSAVPILRWITRHQLDSQRTGETGNMKKNQPTLLTEGCI
ncbi:hypothetical protein THOKLE017_45120 [Klebsiella pneumoniae]|nr:IS3 family element, transposase OrfB [Klebsiella pneumoniae]VGC15039.1 IS3 family element, transposase OrfB [Klebsiella quasipneumoniae]SVW15547.1 IS3 family element, transposase OrfB [Klebsiella pneumoniae]SWP38679.1 IS3 family element, transposase OrfB [Klebsiella pneumoniae]SWS86011.1 IS3 family element, transposase OrfB [Klebsiella pneumoniae]